MEPEARFTAIGAILLVLLLAAAAATVWLTRSGPRSEFRYYTIYFERQSLQGLQVGGDVEMRGVQVGRVERFSIARDNINRVQVTIRTDGRTPVATNTVAVVGRKILTGLARIDLVTPGEPGPELTAVAAGEKYPVITEGHSDLEQIADAVNGLATKGASVLTSVDELLSKDNREAITATLASIRGMADAIKKTAESSERVAASADAAAREAAVTLREIARTSAALERAADVSVHELRATAQEVRSSADIVARTADRLDDPRAAIFGPNPAQLGPGEKMR
jgi:phospholipid/cholesterol/gamma-HCH transport system substrate-binding protein